ncbi:MAG: hypothetical protein ABJJ53_02820 [Sulfitobacter sp.]
MTALMRKYAHAVTSQSKRGILAAIANHLAGNNCNIADGSTMLTRLADGFGESETEVKSCWWSKNPARI